MHVLFAQYIGALRQKGTDDKTIFLKTCKKSHGSSGCYSIYTVSINIETKTHRRYQRRFTSQQYLFPFLLI